MINWRQHLTSLGMLRSVSGGIQWDLNASLREHGGVTTSASLCDHNCTSEDGHYTCPAAISLNNGTKKSSLAPAEYVLNGIDIAVRGLKTAIDNFLSEPFNSYCNAFRVPSDVAEAFRDTLVECPIEVNLSGGNPEIHPEIIPILSSLRSRKDIVTNLTTTGRRVMRDSEYKGQLVQHAPDVIAFSTDEFDDSRQIRDLSAMSLDRLSDYWISIPKSTGQRQKSIEAIYAATLLMKEEKPKISFNLVIHNGNIHEAAGIIRALAESFPKCDIFPYPAQSAFLKHPSQFNDLSAMEQFIDDMIFAHAENTLPITRRLQYWLALKSVFKTYRVKPDTVRDMIGGYGFWRCDNKSLTNRYLQIGSTVRPINKITGGGYLGCNWNQEAESQIKTQIWDLNPHQVSDSIGRNIWQLQDNNQNPCPGCAFPRLLFDVINTEMGLNIQLIPAYLELRQQYAGY